jgi:hypothetical protein
MLALPGIIDQKRLRMRKMIIIIALLLCGVNYGQAPKITLTKLYKIGGEINDKKEYMFVRIDFIKCDSRNNLYVCDGLCIKKYDKNGKYIKQIGRAGEGPGEYKHIKAFTIDEKDNIIVVDQILSRKTVWNPEGKYLSSENLISPYNMISNILPFGGGSFIGIGTSYPRYEEHKNKIVVVDSKFSKYETSFGHTSLFWKMDNPFEILQSMSNELCLLQYKNTKVYASTQTYDGKLYVFDKEKRWDVKICHGYKFDRAQYRWYTEGEYKNLPKSTRPVAAFARLRYKGTEQLYYFNYYNKVFGITDYNDKYIIILLYTKKNDKTHLGFEIYDIEGKYLGYNEISENSMFSYPTKTTIGLAVDNEGNIYMKELS